MKVNAFPTPEKAWAEVLRFTDSDSTDHRIPAMFINTAGFIEITPSIGNENRPHPTVSTWHKYEMSQYLEEDQVKLNYVVILKLDLLYLQYHFEVKFDDQIIGKVKNNNARDFFNVKVWSGLRYFFRPAADVEIRNLEYNSGDKCIVQTNH